MPSRSAADYVNLGHSAAENHVKTETTKVEEQARYRSPQFLWNNIFGFIYHYLKSRFGGRHPYQFYPTAGDAGVYRIPDRLSMALLSDWATDTEESDKLGRLVARHNPDLSLHLGDVYYVGTPQEVRNNFTEVHASWPFGQLGSLVLSGNHEMYSNGKAFFEVLLPAMGLQQPTGFQQQKAGFFCLENDHWRIIGLDTGYTSVKNPFLEILSPPDCDFRPELLEWLEKTVQLGNPDDRRGLIFLSHHPCFSAFRHAFPRPAERLRTLLGPANRVAGWFWGHEHRLVVYDRHGVPGGVQVHARCIGHGGMPIELKMPTPGELQEKILYYDLTPKRQVRRQQAGLNGFALLQFDGPLLGIDFLDIENNRVYTEQWAVDARTGAVTVQHSQPG